MAIIYNPVAEGFYYTLQDQRGQDNPFKVKLKIIPSRDLVKMQDGLLQRTAEDMLTIKTGSYSIAVCKAGIVDWLGLVDEQGEAIPCKLDATGSISDTCLNMLPAMYFEEISNALSAVSQDTANLQLFQDEADA